MMALHFNYRGILLCPANGLPGEDEDENKTYEGESREAHGVMLWGLLVISLLGCSVPVFCGAEAYKNGYTV